MTRDEGLWEDVRNGVERVTEKALLELDGRLRSLESLKQWVELIEAVAKNPILAQHFDMDKLRESVGESKPIKIRSEPWGTWPPKPGDVLRVRVRAHEYHEEFGNGTVSIDTGNPAEANRWWLPRRAFIEGQE